MWKFTKYSTILGGIVLALSVAGMDSAIQQAAGAAMAVGLAVIPYVLARANQEIINQEENSKGEVL